MSLCDDYAETLTKLWEKSSKSTSNQKAIEYYEVEKNEIGKKHISYKELNEVVERVSDKISTQTEENQVIGIHLDSSIELVVSILASLKAKLIFAPLKIIPNVELLSKINASISIKYVLSTEQSYKHITDSLKLLSCEVRILDRIELNADIGSLVLIELTYKTAKPITEEISNGDLAYIVHTSGTTGLPKIVAVPHRCIIPNIIHLAKLFHVEKASKVAMMSPPTFDPSIVEMFMAISNHATLVIPSVKIKMCPEDLGKVLIDYGRVTILQATPALVKRFSVEYLRGNIFCDKSSLEVMAFGGEACPSYKTIKSWLNPDCVARNLVPNQFFNIYGITENSSWATYHKLPSDKILNECEHPVPLGYPLLKTDLQIHCETSNSILLEIYGPDKNSNPSFCEIFDDIPISSLPENVSDISGKLYIGGKDRICNIIGGKTLPFHDSGDLVKVSCIGDRVTINYLGRSDDIVKRNGRKLNLKVMEKGLAKIKEVQSSHVVSIQTKQGGVQVVAFIVKNKCTNIMHSSTEILRSKESVSWTFSMFQILSKSIEMMDLPDRILEVSNLPITPHGKVDDLLLKKLYNSEINSTTESCSLEFEEIKNMLFLILRSTLTVSPGLNCGDKNDFQIDISKTFTQIGGNSFGAVLVIGWLESFLGFSLFEKIPHIFDILLKSSLKTFLEKIICPATNQNNETDNQAFTSRKRKLNITSSGNREIMNESPLAITRGGKFYYRPTVADAFSWSSVDNAKKSVNNAIPSAAEMWKHNTGKCIDASPLVAYLSSNKLVCYIGSHSHLFSCVSVCSGLLQWSKKLPDRIESSACFYKNGGDEFVVVGCYDHKIYTFMASNGQIHWAFATGAEVKSSPTWSQETDLVYVGSHDGCLYALNMKKKKCQWKAYCSGGAVFSSPACLSVNKNDHFVFVATLQGKVLCVCGETGEQIWSYSTGKPIFSSPCANESGVCFGCVDSNVYFLNLQGNLVWRFKTDQPVFSSPCFSSENDGIVIGSHDGFLYKLHIKDGSLLWKVRCDDDNSAVYSTPFPIGKNDGKMGITIYATTSGNVCIVNGIGEISVTTKLPGEVFSSAVIAPTNISNQSDKEMRVLIGCRDDNLYCFNVFGP